MSLKTFTTRRTATSGFETARTISGATLVCTTLFAFAYPACAQDATWKVAPTTNNFIAGSNWSTNTQPTGTAFFGNSNVTSLGFSAGATLEGITFNAGAPAYFFSLVNPSTVILTGAGITNGADLTVNIETVAASPPAFYFYNNASADSATFATENSGARLYFWHDSTAANATITNSGTAALGGGATQFNQSSTAGNANITNNAYGVTQFRNTTTAANATITNNATGQLNFLETATAGSATITNSGDMIFFAGSSAGNANITMQNGGFTEFRQTSTAGTAAITIESGGGTQFEHDSTAGNSTITNQVGGSLSYAGVGASAGNATITNFGVQTFVSTSTAGSADITNEVGGTTRFNSASTAGTATIANLGSLEFRNASSAASATIGNAFGGDTFFQNQSTAADASINTGLSGTLTFQNNSTAANATITTNGNGSTFFTDMSSGGTSRQIINSGGALDVSGLSIGSIGFGSIEGAGDIVLGSKTIVAGSLNANTEFSGVISGTGSFHFGGTGALTFSGANTHTGQTRVGTDALAATLVVDGSLVSDLIVHNTGTLMGIGSLGNTNILGGGTHAPGNSIGTQTVNGSYSNGGTLQIEANDQGDSDQVVVNGMVNIANASLQIIELSGSWGKKKGDAFEYVIVDNDGNDAVAGGFGSITNILAFLDASVVLTGGDGNDIVLTLTRNTTTLTDIAQTPNQKAVATALVNGPLLTNDPDVNDALLGLSAQSARNAYDLMSGEVHASSAHTMIAHSRTLTGMAGERLWSVDNGSGGGANGAQGPAMMGLTGSATQLHNQMALDARMNVGGIDSGFDGSSISGGSSPSLYQRFATWVRGYGERSTLDDDGNGAELDARSGGVMGGADMALTPNLRAGILGNWGATNGSIDERLSSFDINTASVAAYAGYTSGPYLFKGLAGYSHHDIDTTRTMRFGNLNRTAISDYNGNQAILYGEAAIQMGTPDFGLMPLAAVRWSRVNFDGFSEAGAGSLNLTAHSHNETRLESILGLRLATTIKSGALTWLPQARIGWTHAYGDLTPDIDFSFEGGGDFTIAGTTGMRNALTLGAGVNVTNGTGLSGFVDYSGNLSGDGHDHAFSGGLRTQF